MPPVDARIAPRLAYYVSDEIAVLAPRGWHCLAMFGSTGGDLIVRPNRLRTRDLTPSLPSLHGPVIEVGLVYAGSSARFWLAGLIIGFFPRHIDFARRVAAEGLEMPPSPRTSRDRISRVGPEEIRYETPALTTGLGTDSDIATDALPIRGDMRLIGDPLRLVKVDLRLGREVAALADTIISSARPIY
jgi:hypothetical protein